MKPKLNCVLLIDDDEATNFFTSFIIEETDCAQHIKIVEGGQAALDYLQTSTEQGCDSFSYPCPDLILLDINMPGMNGWEFLDEYKKLNKAHHGKIITVMLTTSLLPQDEMRANEMPEISCFENKPLTMEKLENILQKYFVDEIIDCNC